LAKTQAKSDTASDTVLLFWGKKGPNGAKPRREVSRDKKSAIANEIKGNPRESKAAKIPKKVLAPI
jgi:hypothetical protein